MRIDRSILEGQGLAVPLFGKGSKFMARSRILVSSGAVYWPDSKVLSILSHLTEYFISRICFHGIKWQSHADRRVENSILLLSADNAYDDRYGL